MCDDPFKCDKEERMTPQMDWQGEAPDLHGEGTTETVIPALPRVETRGTQRSFLNEFIEDVFSFLRGEESETTIEYAECFDRKRTRLVTRLLQRLTVSPEELRRIKENVLCPPFFFGRKKFLFAMVEEMKKQGIKQVDVSFCLPYNKKMTLKKVFTAPLLATDKITHKQTRTNTSKNPESTTNNPDSTSNNLDSTSNNFDSTSNNPDLTSNSRDSTLLHGQNTPVTQNAVSSNDCITETITESHVMAVKGYFNLDSTTQPPRCAKTQAYKLICMNKIQDFIQMNDEKRRYMFECTFSSEIKAYVSTVITNVNKKVTPEFESDLECLMYNDIRKTISADCCLNVVIEDKNFSLQKKVCQESDIPPPLSTVLNNTISHQNSTIISNDVIHGDSDDVIEMEMNRKRNRKEDDSSQQGTNIPEKAMSEIISSISAIGDLEKTSEEYPTLCIKSFVNHALGQRVITESITEHLARRIAYNNISECRVLAATCDVPFKCDKGERILRQMGWQGGALGLRGEGTTETTIPALPLAPVHIMKQYQTAQTPEEFRPAFFEDVLSFLRAEENETTIEYAECMKQQQVRFLENQIKILKLERRHRFLCKRFYFKYKFEEIFEAMSKQGIKEIQACIPSPYNRKVTLRKVFTTALLATDQNTSKPPEYSQNTSITQNANSLNDFITETITENHVMAVKDHFNLDSSIQPPRCAKTQAYKIFCLTKIQSFIELNAVLRRYTFECTFSSEIKAYVSTVITNVFKKVTPEFESDLECVMYGDIIKTIPAGCYLSVVILDKNFTLYKRGRGIYIPPPLSTVFKNTISHHNKRFIETKRKTNVNESSQQGMMLQMGWQGGALGLREEGTTEAALPLAPVHKISHEFYSEILNDILSFLRAEESEITIEYDNELTKKEIRFLHRKMRILKLEHISVKRDKNFIINNKLEEMFEALSKQGITQVESSRISNRIVKLKKVFTTPLLATDRNTSKTPESTSNNPDSTLNNQDRTLLYSQNTSITQNADSLNDFVTETITENHVMAVKDHFNLDSCIQPPRCAKTQAYKVICLTKIHLFIQMDDERRRYMFECIFSSEIKAYVSTVIMSIIRKVTPQFESDLECVMYGDIRKATPAGCCLSVVIEDQNFTLLKVCQETDVPPPLSTVLKNTISNQNNRTISNGVISGDRDDVILIEKKIDVIVIPDDENNQTEGNSGTVAAVKAENSEKVGEKSTDVITEVSLEGSLICTESQKNRNTDIVDMELDNDIKELVKEIINFTCKEFETPEVNFRALGVMSMEINNKNSNSIIAGSKPNLLFSDHVQPKKEREDTADFEINEKHSTDGTINPSENFKNSYITADDDESQKKMQTEENYTNEATHTYEEHPAEIYYVIHKIKDEPETETDFFEEYKDRSLGNGKRSRSSITIEPESVSKKCKSQIRSVRITCKEPNEVLTVDVMRKVQSVISESIDNITDNADFLPRLECHGVKNGGLIYSCHDEKTFSWMTNFVNSYLDLNITEADYDFSKSHLEIKIYSFEDVNKIFNRLMLYNPDLDTILWRVIDKKEFEDFVIITVEIDRESFDIVKKHNYSLYAGIDKAKFILI